MCQHIWNKVERAKVSEFYIEVRCGLCGARKFIENFETEHRGLVGTIGLLSGPQSPKAARGCRSGEISSSLNIASVESSKAGMIVCGPLRSGGT